MDISQKDLFKSEFSMRENNNYHLPIQREMHFYECVKNGDMKNVELMYIQLGGEGFGVLSDDYITNLRYHLIITVAFLTRYCIDGGIDKETAYNLSDIYIRQADKANSIEEINRIHRQVVMDFTIRMSNLHYKKKYSKPTMKCFDYVHNHLNEKITISDIADELGLTVPYISKIFHTQTGVTLTEYILSKKIDSACQMLKYTEYSASDISNFLGFSSHSHFIQSFKKIIGMTPKQYQNNYSAPTRFENITKTSEEYNI